MFGRSICCLLAVLLLALAPSLVAQFDPASRLTQVGPDGPPDLVPVPSRTSPSHTAPIIFPPRSPGAFDFSQFARAAGMIFSGTVKNIERRPATRGQSIETVAITFHVENAIRGATPGEDLTITQWIGLWSSGQRYRVGERLLLFLYPLSKLGLTSCVGGPIGRFPIDPWGRVLLTAQHLSAFQRDPVLGGKSRLRLSDFALAVRRAGEEE